jgi:lipopolysaccharide export system protein LptC
VKISKISIPAKTLGHIFWLMLVAGTWWFANQLKLGAPAPKHESGQIDYYTTNLIRTVMNAEGKPKETLIAERMTHYKSDDHSFMVQPVMTLFKEDQKPWIVHAKTATLLAGGETVLMHDDVLVTRELSDGGQMVITTRNVTYIPDKNYAETAEDAQVVSPHDKTTGHGAQIYFEPDLLINLLSKVRRWHEVQ